MDQLQTRLDALKQRTHAVERRLRWWRGPAAGLLALVVLTWALPFGMAQEATSTGSCPCWPQDDLAEAVLDTCAGADQVSCEPTTAPSGLVGLRLQCINSSRQAFGEAEAGLRSRPPRADVGVCAVTGFGLPSVQEALTAAETGHCLRDLAWLCPQLEGLLADEPGQPAIDRMTPAAATDPLTTCGTNKKFFCKGTQKILPVGAGDPEDFFYRGTRQPDGTRTGGDQQLIIDRLKQDGGNAIYVIAVKTHGGDGPGPYANPWINGSPANGIDQDILQQWYGWLSQLSANGVVIHFFLYDDHACPYAGGCTSSTLPSQEVTYIDMVVNEFKALPNLVWVVAEEYEFKFSAARVKAIAARIKLNDPTHLVGVHTNDSDVSFQTFASDPNIDVFTAQVGVKELTTYAHDALQSWLAGQFSVAAGRYALELAELYPFHAQMVKKGDRTGLRQSVWAAVMGGAATVMVHGMWDLVNGAAPTSAMLGDLRRARTFFERTNFHTMANASSNRAVQTKYARKNTANDYLLYSRSCRSGALGYTHITTAKTYTLSWYDAIDGSTATQTKSLMAGANILAVPTGMSAECAVWIHD